MKVINEIEQLYMQFEKSFPLSAEKVVSAYRSGPYELTVTLNNGDRIIYDGLEDAAYRRIPKHHEILTEEEWKTRFAKNLSRIIQERRITQEELSNKIGASQGQISRYMKGCSFPGSYHLFKLARALGCSVTRLTELDDDLIIRKE